MPNPSELTRQEPEPLTDDLSDALAYALQRRDYGPCTCHSLFVCSPCQMRAMRSEVRRLEKEAKILRLHINPDRLAGADELLRMAAKRGRAIRQQKFAPKNLPAPE